MRKAAIAGAIAAALAAGAHFNTYRVEVVRVIDADTIEVAFASLPGQVAVWAIRVAEIDTPERLRPNPACREHERALAAKATRLTADAVSNASAVYVTRLRPGKYAKRLLGDVLLADAQDRRVSLADILLASGLARDYLGGEREAWCGVSLVYE